MVESSDSPGLVIISGLSNRLISGRNRFTDIRKKFTPYNRLKTKGGIFMKVLNRIMTIIGYIYATLWTIGVGLLIVHSWFDD